jgi:hypothetical protein
LPQNDLNKYLYPPTISALLKLANTFLNFNIGQSEPTPTPSNP